MTGPIEPIVPADPPTRSHRLSQPTVAFRTVEEEMAYWMQQVNRQTVRHVMNTLQSQVWRETENRLAAERGEAVALEQDNSSPFTRTIGFLVPGFAAQEAAVTGGSAAELTYDALARELAGRVAQRYLKGSNPALRAASIAEALFSHQRHLIRPPVEVVDDTTTEYIRSPETGEWVRVSRTVLGASIIDPNSYQLDNYDFAGWVDLFPKFRNDIGFPITEPPWMEGLPSLFTPGWGEPLQTGGSSSGYAGFPKTGTGNLVLHPNDYYLIETWQYNFGPADQNGVNRILHRDGLWREPVWIGPREPSTQEVQLVFMDDAQISPSRTRVRSPVRKVDPISPRPERLRSRRERMLLRGFTATITETTVAVPSAVTGTQTQNAPVTEPPPPAYAKAKNRTKERKMSPHRKFAGILWWALNGVTESLDAVTSFWKALPPEDRTGMVRRVARDGTVYYKRIFYPTPQEMARDLYRGWNRVDFNQALINVVANQVEDHVIGRTASSVTKQTLPHLRRSGRVVGITTGPAL